MAAVERRTERAEALRSQVKQEEHVWDTGQREQVLGASSKRALLQHGCPMTVSMHPPFVVSNLLAVGASFTVRSKDPRSTVVRTSRIERGERCPVHCLDPSRALVLSLEVDGADAGALNLPALAERRGSHHGTPLRLRAYAQVARTRVRLRLARPPCSRRAAAAFPHPPPRPLPPRPGFHASSSVTLKPVLKLGRRSRYLPQTLQTMRHIGKLLPELSERAPKVKMLDRKRRPLNVHLDTWEGDASTFHIAAFTTYWLVNKSSLPLAFRRMVPTFGGGQFRPETQASDDYDGLDAFDDDEPLLLGSAERGSCRAPPQAFPSEPTEYNPLEVTSGPLMISYTRPNWEWPFNNASVKVSGETGWSSTFKLDQPASLAIESRSHQGSYDLGIDCKFAPEPFHRTRLVFICSRFVLANETSTPLQYKQVGMHQSTAQTVYPNGEVIFHWPNRKFKRQLQVRLNAAGDGSVWSTPFGVNEAGENFVVKVRRPARDNWEHLHVAVQLVEPVVFVSFSEGKKEHAPVMVDNQLREAVTLNQKGVDNRDAVRPGEVLPYVWDLPLERRLVLVATFGAIAAVPKSGVRRELVIDGKSNSEFELKLPPTTTAEGVGVRDTLPARSVVVRVEAVDCQRCIVTFREAMHRSSQLFGSMARRGSLIARSLTGASLRTSISPGISPGGSPARQRGPLRSSVASGVQMQAPRFRAPDGGFVGRLATGATCVPTALNSVDAASDSEDRRKVLAIVSPRGVGFLPTVERAGSEDRRCGARGEAAAVDKASLRVVQSMKVPSYCRSRCSSESDVAAVDENLLFSPRAPVGTPRALPAPDAADGSWSPGRVIGGGRKRRSSEAKQTPLMRRLEVLAEESTRIASPREVPRVSTDEPLPTLPPSPPRVAASRGDPRSAPIRHSMYALGSTAARRGKQDEMDFLALLQGELPARSTPRRAGVCGHEYLWADEPPARRSVSVEFACESIELSIIDEQPMELLYVTISDLKLSMSEGTNDSDRPDGTVSVASLRYEQRVEIEVHRLQVDNQRYNTAYPVTVSTYGRDGVPWLHVRAVRDVSFERRSFVYLPLLQVHIEPMSVMVDEESVRAFLGFVGVFGVDGTERRERARSAAQQPSTLFEHTMLVPISPNRELGGHRPTVWSKIFVEHVRVSSISLRATLKRSPDRAEHLSVNPLLALFNSLTTTLINIDDAPVHFRPLHRAHFFVTPAELGRSLVAHYRSALWRVVLAVASSLDAFGKPYESVTDLQEGFRAFLIAPFFVLFSRPSRFLLAVLRGAVELIKALVRVPLNAVSKILLAWAKGLALLALDADFSQERLQDVEFRRAAHVLQGLRQGTHRLLSSLSSAVFGFYRQAFQGLTRNGIRGSLAGLARAPVGAIVKPAVGVLDLAAKVLEGVKNMVVVLPTAQQRVRPPRIFHVDRVLRPFQKEEAQAQSMLAHCRTGLDARNEQEFYVDHFSVSWTRRDRTPGRPKLLLITSQVAPATPPLSRPCAAAACPPTARRPGRAAAPMSWLPPRHAARRLRRRGETASDLGDKRRAHREGRAQGRVPHPVDVGEGRPRNAHLLVQHGHGASALLQRRGRP